MAELTPMMKQYFEIKNQNKDYNTRSSVLL